MCFVWQRSAQLPCIAYSPLHVIPNPVRIIYTLKLNTHTHTGKDLPFTKSTPISYYTRLRLISHSKGITKPHIQARCKRTAHTSTHVAHSHTLTHTHKLTHNIDWCTIFVVVAVRNFADNVCLAMRVGFSITIPSSSPFPTQHNPLTLPTFFFCYPLIRVVRSFFFFFAFLPLSRNITFLQKKWSWEFI